MLIRMIVSMAGPRVSVAPGDLVEWDDYEAPDLIAAGYAEPFEATIIDGVAYTPDDLAAMDDEELAELGLERGEEHAGEAISEASVEAPAVEAPATPAAAKPKRKKKPKPKKPSPPTEPKPEVTE